jgi:hypothetical protein
LAGWTGGKREKKRLKKVLAKRESFPTFALRKRETLGAGNEIEYGLRVTPSKEKAPGRESSSLAKFFERL